MLKLTIAYDGTAYVGWQRQAMGTSIQGLLEEAVAHIEGVAPEAVTVTGAGRTDAGVHALAQVASVRVASRIPCESYLRALNVALPADVRVRCVEEAPDRFRVRFSAVSKIYRYRLLNAPTASPFEERYAWHVSYPLDVQAMRDALDYCVGDHDFATFRAAGGVVSSTVRTIYSVSLLCAADMGSIYSTEGLARDSLEGPDRDITAVDHEARKHLLIFSLEGNGFLRHMVRNIVGTIVEVGRGRWEPSEVARLIEARDRSQGGPTAPPNGLFLDRVLYETRSPESDPESDPEW